MEYFWIIETIIIFLVGKMILRIGGRKSISQMTITQTIVMIGIGSLLIQPISGKDTLKTLLVAFLFTLLMVISEYLELKFDWIESFFSGKSVIVIEDGKPLLKNLRKLRLTVDRLETRLRQNGVNSIEDIKIATIEVSGQLGYELKDEKKPITKEDFILILSELFDEKKIMDGYQKTIANSSSKNNIFDEIKSKKYEGKNEP